MTETTEVYHVELACGTETLLRACAEPRTTRDSLARTYALAICSSEPVDWAAVNEAIRERWSEREFDGKVLLGSSEELGW